MLIMHVWTTSFPWYGNSYHGGGPRGDGFGADRVNGVCQASSASRPMAPM
jgi:hypothetical protein